MTRPSTLFPVAVMLLCGGAAGAGKAVDGLRVWSLHDATRVVIEVAGNFTYKVDRAQSPERIFFDITGAKVRILRQGIARVPVGDALVKQIRVAQWQHGVSRIVFDLNSAAEYSASQLSTPDRLIVELRRSSNPVPATEPLEAAPPLISAVPPATAAATPGLKTRPPVRPVFRAPPDRRPRVPAPRPVLLGVPMLADEPLNLAQLADPTHARERASRAMAKASPAAISHTGATPPSLTRVLGLKVGRIVLDAGHGGHDTGTAGPSGYLEKDLVLDVALRLGDLIAKRMGAEVIYTRSDDTFIPLQDRTRLANEHHADLFLSVHANSSPDNVSSGVETYYLNFTTNQYALEVAARENATSDKTVNDLPNLVQLIAKNDKVEESRQFATKVQSSLYSFSVRGNAKARDRGIKKAPFVVLVGAQMPSILCEIGFLSNARDESLLKKPEYRQKLAEALYKGLQQYAGTLSHLQVATR